MRPDQAAQARAVSLADGLFPHQVEGIAFLLARRRAILADDMGLGKTRQSVLAMVEAEPGGPWLVVCPASVKLNWRREIQIALGDQAVVEIIDRKNPVPRRGYRDWLVINYDILKKHAPKLQKHAFAGIVFDEAHYLKNHTSQRSKAARALVDDAESDPVVHCLTGTPLTNRPRDLFPLLQLVDHALGKSFLSFAKRYCDAVRGEYGWITDGASHIEELTVQLHGTMLRRRKDDVLDLPGKLRSWFSVEIPPSTGRLETKQFLESILESAGSAHTVKREPGGDASSIALLGKLAPVRKQIAIAKVKRTAEFVRGILDQGEKVIVYSCFTHRTEMFAEIFGEVARTLTGKTPLPKRQQIIDEFQSDQSVRLLIANIIAGGVGVNLTAARHVVFNDLDWVPANHWQAEDRAYRIGQTAMVNAYYFAATDTLDEFVSEVLKRKSEIVRAVIEGESVAIEGAATVDVLSELRSLLAAAETEDLDGFLKNAATMYRDSREPAESEGARTAVAPSSVISRDAVLALARALDREDSDAMRYLLPSGDGNGDYTLEVDGTDVTCSCRGFSYRGQCKHSRELKAVVANGESVPESYERLE